MSPPTNTSINDLPAEIVSELFKYLQLKDLVFCSMVNKRWNSIYAALRLHRMIAIDYLDHDFETLYDSNQTIFDRCRSVMFLPLAEKPLLSNLKQLALVGSFEFDLNRLNRFQRLVHLEIKLKNESSEKVHLNLPKLKVLAFHHWNTRCELSIDSPLLSTLLYGGERESASLLNLRHPQTIRKLDTGMIGTKLNQFECVECLVTNRYEMISRTTIRSLPRLREFYFNDEINFKFWSGWEGGIYHDVKQTLTEFLDEAKRLRGNDFRFSFCGFQLANVDVNQISVQIERNPFVSKECIYLKNYQLIEPSALHFVQDVNYTLLHATGAIPRCFSQTFTGIYLVEATAKVRDPSDFLRFLKSLRSLRKLNLKNTALSQTFFDQLPASAHSLVELNLIHNYCKEWLQRGSDFICKLNFNFIGKFSGLLQLSIQPSFLSFESVHSLAGSGPRSLDKLKSCSFNVDLNVYSKRERRHTFSRFRVLKEANSKVWNITAPEGTIFTMKNPVEIMNFFEGLQIASQIALYLPCL